MNLLLVTCGLPGSAYHGGAVTCWTIIKMMLLRGHKVTVLSFFDESDLNPYLDAKDTQVKALQEIGASVKFAYYNHKEFIKHKRLTSFFSKIAGRVYNFLTLTMDILFPWANLRLQAQEAIKNIIPDAIFCYHFDALSAIYNIKTAPIMAGLGDLWHLPAYFRWKAMPFSIKKYLFSYLKYLVAKSISKKLMLEMLNHCQKKGAFANHYARLLMKQKGYKDVLYLRTPVHDPVGDKWLELRNKYGKQNKKHRILMIGDVTGTASKWGFRLLINEILPILENKYGSHGFEINIIGGGLIDNEFKILKELPYINIKGRVTPPDEEFLSSDILLVPTPIDLGIRVRIITGFSYGSCVVTHKANVKGIPEIIHKYNALVSESGYGLAQEVITALENNELRYILGKNARKTYENYFSEEVAAKEIIKDLEKLAAK